MSRIDVDNPVEVEKVDRYIKHIAMYRRMEKRVKEEGVSVTTKNASQTFIKSHPLLKDMNSLNTAIINIERSFNFLPIEQVEINKPIPPEFTASDLI